MLRFPTAAAVVCCCGVLASGAAEADRLNPSDRARQTLAALDDQPDAAPELAAAGDTSDAAGPIAPEPSSAHTAPFEHRPRGDRPAKALANPPVGPIKLSSESTARKPLPAVPLANEDSHESDGPRRQSKALKLAPPQARPEGIARWTGALASPTTLLASLGGVLALFLLLVWLARRAGPKGTALLPREAVEVLGRAPLLGKTQMHLLRCGNKVVLIAATPGGIETIAEIDDPLEVDRLLGICQQAHSQSASTAFQQLLRQFEGKGSSRNIFGEARPDADTFADIASQVHGQEPYHA